MTKVKFCGLTRLEDIRAANELMPEYIGFVFAKKSKRYLEANAAKELKLALRSEIKAVGVFVNEYKEKISEIANANIIDIIQIHGDEDENYIKSLRKLTDKPIMQAIRLKTSADAKKAHDSAADFILLDSGYGQGETFDWTLAEKITRPYFLAGGLSEKNIAEAIQKLNPFAVDVSSGIETEGKKDPQKMKKFMEIVRDNKNKEKEL